MTLPVVQESLVLLCKIQACMWYLICVYFPLQLEYERKKKEEGKRARADKQQVLDMLFSAFEKHQYYNIKDLVDITKQPVVRLQGNAKRLVMKPKCTVFLKKSALHWTF